MFFWKLFKQENNPKENFYTIDTKSSRIFFSCNEEKNFGSVSLTKPDRVLVSLRA